MEKSYAPRILVEFTVGGTTYRFATEDLYDFDDNFFEGTLANPQALQERLQEHFWGTEQVEGATLSFGNRSGLWHTLANNSELRGVFMIIRYYDRANGEDNALLRERIKDEILLENDDEILMESEAYEMLARARIQGYDIKDMAEISVELKNSDPYETLLPQKLVNTDDWPQATDLGTPINIIFGASRNVSLIYIAYDYGSDHYDYLIGYGPILSVDAVYRDGSLVGQDEYVAYNGNQESPYPGYAFIRFGLEQKGFSGQLHKITADISGYPQNFSYVIRDIISNSLWGLNKSVDENSFAAAKDDLNTIGSMYCDGLISSQRRVKNIIDDLSLLCRARLTQNQQAEWQIEVDTYQTEISAYFGHEDGYYENILEITKRGKTPIQEAYREITLRYAKNDRRESTPYYENTRGVFAFGTEKVYETDFVQHHTTADKITCYLAKHAEYADGHLEIRVGMDGKDLRVGQLVSVNIADYSINKTMKIKAISKDLESCHLILADYSSDIYGYAVGSIPSDEDIDGDEYYGDIPPDAPA